MSQKLPSDKYWLAMDAEPNHAWRRSLMSYNASPLGRRKHGLAGRFRQRQQRRLRSGRSGRFDREIERLRAEYDRS